MELTGIDHLSISVTRFDETREFWGSTLGLEEVRYGEIRTSQTFDDRNAPAGATPDVVVFRQVMFRVGHTILEFNERDPRLPPPGDGFIKHLALQTDDVDGVYQRLLASEQVNWTDHTRRYGPHGNPHGHLYRRRLISFRDPNGLYVQISEPHPELGRLDHMPDEIPEVR